MVRVRVRVMARVRVRNSSCRPGDQHLEALAQGGGREVVQQEVAIQRVRHRMVREHAVEARPQQNLRCSHQLGSRRSVRATTDARDCGLASMSDVVTA